MVIFKGNCYGRTTVFGIQKTRCRNGSQLTALGHEVRLARGSSLKIQSAHVVFLWGGRTVVISSWGERGKRGCPRILSHPVKCGVLNSFGIGDLQILYMANMYHTSGPCPRKNGCVNLKGIYLISLRAPSYCQIAARVKPPTQLFRDALNV